MALPTRGYMPTLLDRLCGDHDTGAHMRMTIEQLKDSVARDLEALLNTRAGIDAPALADFECCRTSILAYGLIDFAGSCLSSIEDRAAICASLKRAIEQHEPRLREVSATLESEPGSVNRLNFCINASLQVAGSADCADPAEAVNFNAVLQPSSLHYSISKARAVRA
ncbi:MAG: type secretion system baseplate subunit TssE [Massilia sp.]|nr:type secretion system baseplate subunit TssE [Massilia sp.]